LPKTVNLTDFSASERSDIGLMSDLCCFWAKCEGPCICQTEK